MGNPKKRPFNFIVYMIPRTDCNSHKGHSMATEDPEAFNAGPEEGESNISVPVNAPYTPSRV